MEGNIRGRYGGIFGLLDLLDEYQEAIEFELIATGLRLRDLGGGQFNWRDLYVLIRRWQKTPDNALAANLRDGELPSWLEQVMAVVVDQLQAINFNIRKGKGQRPKRFQRWWEKQKRQVFGRDPIPIAEFDDWWETASRR